VAAISEQRPFWLGALLGIPVINTVFLAAVASVSGDLFIPVAALVALGEIPLLVLWARTHRIGALGALGAILGNVAITLLGLILVLLVTLSIACSGEAQCFT
jgi:hypothetical protein